MPVHTSVYEAKRVIYYQFVSPWTVREMISGIQNARNLSRETRLHGGLIINIYDMTESDGVPEEGMVVASRMELRKSRSELRHIVIAPPSDFVELTQILEQSDDLETVIEADDREHAFQIAEEIAAGEHA